MEMHYLDNAATTRVLPEAAQAAMKAMTEEYGNPSALYALGAEARRALSQARADVALALGCKAEQLVFTSCGTEAINTALFSAVYRGRRIGRHIVSTRIEHKATLETLKALESEGCEVTLVDPQPDGTVSAEEILAAVREDTALVTMMAVNSETGAILPTAQVAEGLKHRNSAAMLHIDAVQAFCKIPFDPAPYDFVSVSGHKIGACKGVGALYAKNIKTVRPRILGGGQENGLRSGTEGMPQIMSFGAAARLRGGQTAENAAKMQALKQEILLRLTELPCGVRINSPENSAPHILNISPEKGRSEVLLRVLSDEGVFVSGGSACSRGRRSEVLTAMKVPAKAINSALRISLCPETTHEDVEALLEGLKKALAFF